MWIHSLKLQFWSLSFILKCQQYLKKAIRLTPRGAIYLVHTIHLITAQVLLPRKALTCFLILRQSLDSLKFLSQSSRFHTFLKWMMKKMTTDHSLSSQMSKNPNERIASFLLRLSKIQFKQRHLLMHFEKRNNKLSQKDPQLKMKRVLRNMQEDELRRKY